MAFTSRQLDIIQRFKLAQSDRLSYWQSQAQSLDFFKTWDSVLDWKPPFASWFRGAKINACYNCIDRHLGTSRDDKVAIYWEGERGEDRALTYKDLYQEVNKMASILQHLGVVHGDKVALYMPMIPEAIVAMLACSRLGAIHSVVFAGFSSEALKDRINDCQAKVLITADGGFRKGKLIPLKELADKALEGAPCIEHTLVIAHAQHDVYMKPQRDHFYHDLLPLAKDSVSPSVCSATDPLFILYTSGTTGKPKGIVHSTAGYLVGVSSSMKTVFDLQEDDIYFCTADIGWITGHSYVVYGPLSQGATVVIYEGAPDYPEKNRYWQIIEKYKVSILYTAPTLIRMFMKWGHSYLEGFDLSSLRLLGSVGEPINPEAWNFYYQHVGGSRCPVIDTWWQTETGSIMMAPLAGFSTLKPGSASGPLPGIDVALFDETGKAQNNGYLVITSPWPSMFCGVYNDPERYKKTYFELFGPSTYLTGDGASLDESGLYTLSGRLDDVINVSGHRLGTMEIESALVDHPTVAEAAACGVYHSLKGQGIVCFVILKENAIQSENLESDLKKHIDDKIGPIARPESITFVKELPKTRSGKIMRRLLRDLAEGRATGDVTSLQDPQVLNLIRFSLQEV